MLPEYDPYKYNSFTANAGDQIHQLTRRIAGQLAALVQPGGVAGMPPVLGFQSIVDATVSTDAVVDALYAKLAPGGHALVAFDLNRLAEAQPLFAPGALAVSRNLLEGPALPFELHCRRQPECAQREGRRAATPGGCVCGRPRADGTDLAARRLFARARRAAVPARRSALRRHAARPPGHAVPRPQRALRRARAADRDGQRPLAAAPQPFLAVRARAHRPTSCEPAEMRPPEALCAVRDDAPPATAALTLCCLVAGDAAKVFAMSREGVRTWLPDRCTPTRPKPPRCCSG